MNLGVQIYNTDILIIGAGAAGCYSALTLHEKSDCKVILVDKANIRRSGCLAGGINALNGYINKGDTPDSYVDYVKKDSQGIVREDLLITMAEKIEEVTRKIESMGLPILKDENGNYIPRGRRGIRINGENIKPILARSVRRAENVIVMNKVNMIDYIIRDGRVIGAYGFMVNLRVFVVIYAKAVICATGGAAGLYLPKHWSFSRHKIWYCPFNTGAGYAMGIRAGAEMTTFEMRFIALRCKDTISPTGTIAGGLNVRQVNKTGEEYAEKYKSSTPGRLFATIQENLKGKGPCYLETKGISEDQEQDLFKAYFNMSIAQPVKWLENDTGPAKENVEIEGTEPYIVGGHAASGYWVDTGRGTTLKGLYAAGDVVGGSPKKYVPGCFAEGLIASVSALEYIKSVPDPEPDMDEIIKTKEGLERYFDNPETDLTIEDLELMMQDVMDKKAGGISENYIIYQNKLLEAEKEIVRLSELVETLKASTMHDLLFIHEVKDRLLVCRALIAHILARKESRWYCYLNNADYPNQDDQNWLKYVNSVYKDGKFNIIYRELVGRDEIYEHKDITG
ncbi:MAG: adenylyl-sulfate reductase subunit alpha [Clostridiaceae bacterium]|nr:adenylyl-sulfate reductase subunit alpha [Clostridiaceae bacterium]